MGITALAVRIVVCAIRIGSVNQPEPTVTESNQIPIAILRRCRLEVRVGLSRSTIYDKINPKSPRYDATFPKPIRLGGGAVGWLEHEVTEWLNSQIEASRRATK